MKLTNEQIEKAVTWWADQVAKPTFSALNDEERKDPENTGMQFAEFLASKAVEPVTQEQREKFMEALRGELQKEGANWGLFTDYGPDLLLRNAAEKAGISTNNFPWKTSMWFRDGKVIASLGYGGEQVEL